MNIKEGLRRKPWMGDRGHGRLLEEVTQDYFEVQSRTFEEKGLEKLFPGD